MTDDLVKRLENVRCDGVEELCWEAADRIEQLAAINEELEAKLEKAVEALEEIVVDDTWGLNHKTYMKCRNTLAELKG